MTVVSLFFLKSSTFFPFFFFFFFFNDTATTEIYTLSLHDALPISLASRTLAVVSSISVAMPAFSQAKAKAIVKHARSEEHTSELQSPCNLVCRLLLEKKKKTKKQTYIYISSFHYFHIVESVIHIHA